MSQARVTRCARKYNMRINVEVGPEQCVTKGWATLSVSYKPLRAPRFAMGPSTADHWITWLNSGLWPSYPYTQGCLRGHPEKSAPCLWTAAKPAILAAASVQCFYCLCSFENWIRDYRKYIKYINKNTAWAFKQCFLCNHHQMAQWLFSVPWPEHHPDFYQSQNICSWFSVKTNYNLCLFMSFFLYV